jgi:hypothetical protein
MSKHGSRPKEQTRHSQECRAWRLVQYAVMPQPPTTAELRVGVAPRCGVSLHFSQTRRKTEIRYCVTEETMFEGLTPLCNMRHDRGV